MSDHLTPDQRRRLRDYSGRRRAQPGADGPQDRTIRRLSAAAGTGEAG